MHFDIISYLNIIFTFFFFFCFFVNFIFKHLTLLAFSSLVFKCLTLLGCSHLVFVFVLFSISISFQLYCLLHLFILCWIFFFFCLEWACTALSLTA
ncbi:hypothetical protein IC575_008776 [Cucumis melo]